MDMNVDRNVMQDDLTLVTMGPDFECLVNTMVCATDLLTMELREASEHGLGEQARNQYADVIRLAGADMMLLVNSIMDDDDLMEEPVGMHRIYDMQEEMLKVLKQFSMPAMMKSIRLELDIDPSITHVLWDMDKLRIHVINNILTNLMRYLPRGGRILIRVDDVGHGTVVISISDYSTAILTEEISSVSVAGGSHHDGFELSNAMRVAKACGGSMTVIGCPGEKGVTFQIELPDAGVVMANAQAVGVGSMSYLAA